MMMTSATTTATTYTNRFKARRRIEKRDAFRDHVRLALQFAFLGALAIVGSIADISF